MAIFATLQMSMLMLISLVSKLNCTELDIIEVSFVYLLFLCVFLLLRLRLLEPLYELCTALQSHALTRM